MEQELKKLEQEVENNAEKIDRNYQMVLDNTQRINENLEKITKNSVALDILKDYKKQTIRAYIVIWVLLVIVAMLSAIVIYHHWVV